MKKNYLFAVMAATVLASCSNSDEIASAVEAPQVEAQIPVGFGAYASRATTRTETTLDVVKNQGFGVFAYYTDNQDYEQTAIPNFMYNQKVSTEAWTYSPIKYWPNEYGKNAMADDIDRISFFAYTPYVDVTANTGKLATTPAFGITGLSHNSYAGDPMVKFITSFDADASKQVDLCWGVCKTANSWTAADGTTSGVVGLPWTNVRRAGTTDQKLTFDFVHALSNLNVQVKTDEQTSAGDATKIYIRSISFEGLSQKGALCLNNSVANTADWRAYTGTNELEAGQVITVYDGLKDGYEGTFAEASNEKVTGLNAALIQKSGSAGVTTTAANLFGGASNTDPIYVIPTGEDLKVTVAYEVETQDPNLATYLSDGTTAGSRVKNVITRTITLDGTPAGTPVKLESGKKYVITLTLGMNSIKFNASINAWGDDNAGSAFLPEAGN